MDKFESSNSNSPVDAAPEELVMRAFARCSNNPKERAGILGLAQGLKAASDRFGVTMVSIIRECVESSTFCPTDTDLLNVARELRGPEKVKAARSSKCPFALCDGSGWRECWHFHTHHGGAGETPAYVEKKLISREEYLVMAKVWGPGSDGTQQVYESRYRCKCHPPREPDAEPKPRRKSSKLQKASA